MYVYMYIYMPSGFFSFVQSRSLIFFVEKSRGPERIHTCNGQHKYKSSIVSKLFQTAHHTQMFYIYVYVCM